MYTIWLQVNIFIGTLIWGLILGVVFDVYRFIFPSNKVKGITQYILDTLFWISVTVATFGVLIFTDHGQVRIYLLFAMAIGFVLYMLLFSRLTLKILTAIRKVIIKVYSILRKILRKIFIIIKMIMNIIKKIVMFLLFPFRWLIFIIFKPTIAPFKKIINKISRK
ncbi:hypothetical protein HYG86_08795 [Alkalicella caledoniensis]|uniref:Spore cortex biosynthesis protein YabQ n=1 Tax=Alkalicella caledoniensis TaxID=2731377 RepID=A0A7G9W851_ALKCA|nr:spore cortex biosynthesis protein YabQ [Alkalicella caledoniensis]QNO14863.1 hypothetical protein HYG86_08795 [Alkalicella caledoniensis]